MRTVPDIPCAQIFSDADELAEAAAARFITHAKEAQSGRFSVALAGGTTPRRVYQLLAEEKSSVDWTRCHLFFGDERCVPPDDPDSNYRMANESLLSRVDLPAENIHRIRGEGDAVANAQVYEDELRGYFGSVEWPIFDLVLLGMGEDAHTASLFPHTRALAEQSAWVAANWVEKIEAFRITLTAPAINRAKEIIFLVAGSSKAVALRDVLKGERDTDRLPAQLIYTSAGNVSWFVDEAAAAKL